jgi:hypothetical protein
MGEVEGMPELFIIDSTKPHVPLVRGASGAAEPISSDSQPIITVYVFASTSVMRIWRPSCFVLKPPVDVFSGRWRAHAATSG